MPFFKYQAISKTGKKIQGMIDASSIDQATKKLNQQKILVLDVKPTVKTSKIPKDAVVLFTKELARLLGAGLALYEALQTMEEKYRGSKTHPLFLRLLDQIKRGEKLSKALEKEPIFSRLYLSMVANSEKTGKLKETLDELADLMSKQDKLKKEMVSALIYPSILLSFCFFVLYSLLFYVVPSLSELFQGKNLHPMTSFVLGASNFATKHQWSILLSILGIGSGLFVICKLQKTKDLLLGFVLKLPLIKNVFLQLSLIRFSRALSSLMGGGVAFLQGIGLAKETLSHPQLKKEITRAEKGVLEGKKFSNLLQSSAIVPPLFVRLMAIAEESGKLDVMLSQISFMYEEEVEKTFKRITAVLQPLLLILLGLMVGFVLLAVLLPLTDFNSIL